MDVIGHNDGGVKAERFAVIVDAVSQGQGAGLGRELDGLERAKCYKKRPVVALIVRETAAIFVSAESGGWHWKDSCQS